MMERLHYTIDIQANADTVYQCLIDKESFQRWTSVFSPTSRYEGDWSVGSTMRFLSTGDAGSLSGMISQVRENIPGKFLSLEHRGLISNGKEITEGPDVASLKGAMENYTLMPDGESTTLEVDSDTFGDLKDYFQDVWPKALQLLKQICEEKQG